MKELTKIDSLTLYRIWKNFAVSLILLIAMFTLSKLFIAILTPMFALVCAGIIYTMFIQRKASSSNCVIVPYGMMISMICYSFVTVVIAVTAYLQIFDFPTELQLTANRDFIPSLVYFPIGFLTFAYIAIRRRRLRICMQCRSFSQSDVTNIKKGPIVNYESRYQVRNLVIVFGLITGIIWYYYLYFYININQNSRDWYVFTWLIVVVILLDILYFILRYYNLYLDLKEADEVVDVDNTTEEASVSTYLRYYVICQDSIYLDIHSIKPESAHREVIDTPFFTKRNVNGIGVQEVRRIIERMTGVEGGELRFFYGRRSTDQHRYNLLRYFYFIDGTPEEHPHLRTDGEWVPFSKIKQIYSLNPSRLDPITVIDTSRLSAIMITRKVYDEQGYRRSKIKAYRPTYTLIDVRNNDIDYQSDEWIRISTFNADTPFFRIKKFWRNLIGRR